jgi:phage gp36-like protein
MNYATQEDMINLFGEAEIIQLTNLDNPNLETIDPVRLDQALDYASREVDSYLQVAQYQLPLISVPLVLRNKVADIARYHLDSYQAREDVRQRYEDAVKWLQLLASGKVGLGIDKITQEQISTGGAQWFSQERIFPKVLGDYYG